MVHPLLPHPVAGLACCNARPDTARFTTNEAIRQIEQFAEAQATWLEQVSLKDRATFLEEQKALHGHWKADMEALLEGQNTALRQVMVQTAALLRAQTPAAGPILATPPTPLQGQAPAPTGMRNPWAWIWGACMQGYKKPS